MMPKLSLEGSAY
jgi:hypothetical protein